LYSRADNISATMLAGKADNSLFHKDTTRRTKLTKNNYVTQHKDHTVSHPESGLPTRHKFMHSLQKHTKFKHARKGCKNILSVGKFCLEFTSQN